MESVLRTSALVKKYHNKTVVNKVNITVKSGEVVGLLGPNGAGKTTTFYIMVGLIAANEGTVFLDELDITYMPMYKRARNGISYLPQEASVFGSSRYLKTFTLYWKRWISAKRSKRVAMTKF